MWNLLAFILIALSSVDCKWYWGECRPYEFKCRDGRCVSGHSPCNGTIECPDGSDEIYSQCWNNKCYVDQFRCAYGACVDGMALCDESQDCADNSDELIHFCNNDIDSYSCSASTDEFDVRSFSNSVTCVNRNGFCETGRALRSPVRCDGKVDCEDGSDETLTLCADAECNPPLLKCAYGGCVHQYAACDGIKDCADGSDEWEDFCEKILPPKNKTTAVTSKNTCILPPQPEHGSYTVGGLNSTEVGKELKTFYLKYSCDPLYNLNGSGEVICYEGTWSGDKPKCIRFCHLPKHESVDYTCHSSGADVTKGEECKELVPSGTIVTPRCKEPVYKYHGTMFNMHCEDGKWDYVVHCTPECGKLGKKPDAFLLEFGNRDGLPNELPWHVGIYNKRFRSHVCGGSIVSNEVVISAASCFWSDKTKKQPERNYLVAAGKLYRAWSHPSDIDAQISEVRAIEMPPRFLGAATNYQNDIALVFLETRLQYSMNVRPVCLDFGGRRDAQQLKEFSVGKIGGWGKSGWWKGKFSVILRAADAPFIPILDCMTVTPREYRSYITSDKFCAGYQNGTGICKRIPGSGLSFPLYGWTSIRYYLRGVASSAINGEKQCSEKFITSYTHVVTHKSFIQQFLPLKN